MRNLSILSEQAAVLPEDYFLLSGDEHAGVRNPGAAFCIDVTEEEDCVYVVAGNSSNSAFLLLLESGRVADTIPLPFAAAGSNVASMHFMVEREMVVVVLASGDIYTVTKSGNIDAVGTVDAGIAAAAWSPDEEVLAMVTNEGRLLLMTNDFDPLDEFPLAQGEQGEEIPVAVGWGSVDTQYHGREKQATDTHEQQQQQQVSAAGANGGYDDRRVRISWRGDGAFVAVSYLTAEERREIRVFTREGRLHSAAERVDALEHALAWKPSGQLFASTQRLPHRHDVVFFERNGLRHGGFSLRGTGQRVLDLAWNADSSVLAVVVEESGCVYVELWTDKNYHWYLKQRIGSELVGAITHVVWHLEEPLRLYVASATAMARVCLHSAPSVARVASEASNAAACVVDGASILYTPFSYANVPPPMALHTLELPRPAAHAVFAGFGDGNDFAVLLADRKTVVCYCCDYASRVAGAVPPRKLCEVSVGCGAWVRQIAWPQPHLLVSLGAYQSTGSERGMGRQALFVTEFDDLGQASTQTFMVDDLAEGADIALLTAAPHIGKVLAAAVDGQVYVVNLQSGGADLLRVAHLPEACVEIDAVRTDDDDDDSIVVLGRTGRNQLFANDHLLSTMCLSFYLRRDMLLFTTTTHSMRFVQVGADLTSAVLSEGNEADGNGSAKYDERQRRVESGSTIVLASPVGDAVVLQMPRGNLETIRPRALVLAAVRRMLDARRFRDAVATCRVNRIDMNIIHDHAPATFMDELPEFVRQVDNPDLLNLFVTSLRDEDVTKSMYTGMDKSASGADSARAGKVNSVCRALRPVLQALGEQRYMPTLLTTLVCQAPADIPGALQLLAPLAPEERETALTYLLYLSDVDTVYDAALGMYDLPLALLVAQRSQRDPREYLPALGKLHAIADEEYRRYCIDVQLKHPELALRNLCAAYENARSGNGDEAELWREVRAFVAERELYELALGLLADNAVQHADMCRLYGDYLAAAKQWAQAAAAYLLAGTVPLAIESFIQASEWRTAMSLASNKDVSGFSEQMVHDAAVQASLVLTEHHRFADAARVLLEYTGEDEEAVALFVRGAHWAEAIRYAHLNGRADLVETTVVPGVETAANATLDDIEEIATTITTKLARLREVRATPLEVIVNAHAMMQRADGDDALDNVDVMSDTASMASQFSTFTGTVTNATSNVTGSTARRISKSRIKKKEERRRIRGKKGSIYEESYLVDSISKLVDRVRVNQSAVHDVCLVLIQFARPHVAQKLQKEFAALVLIVLDNADYVFDQQRVQLQMGENGVPEPVPVDTNSFGVSSQPKHPKPVLPTFGWKISALL
ncbi:putative elongator complex protein 1 [Coemansia biformis]|uniref:Elongator complex protein 1 n=1 Tax=Coemansia biformis TaxID=1286918 RepID=A0A9W7Y4U6_9FUNG|nr:putative elongator complex protein 1 [Coemansia biformis]